MLSLKPYLKLCLLITAFQIAGCQKNTNQDVLEQSFYHNVEGVTEQKLHPEYWIAKATQPSKVIMSAEKIKEFNALQFQSKEYLTDPLTYPSTMVGTEVTALIKEISKPSKYDRFYPDGTKLTQAHYQPYLDEMALDKISAEQTIGFALVTKRAVMRMLPTLDRVLNSGMDYDIDRFQETAAFPGEALAILHTSKSGEWMFVQNYNYRAWIQTKHVAVGEKADIEKFKHSKDFLLITGAKEFTTFNPYDESTSEVQLDMGVTLPLISYEDFEKHELDRLNPYTGHIVQLPTRNADGTLTIKPSLIPRSADVNIGYLAHTKENIIKQSFKFLGERYGWGHDFNARDCTGFIGEIYKTFGFLMPRNSGQQGNAEFGENIRFEKQDPINTKMPKLMSMEAGDLVYLPGHVAMVLGYDDDKPFLIHDVHGLGYHNSKGEKISGILNGVSVTPLLVFESYLKGIYNIKKIR